MGFFDRLKGAVHAVTGGAAKVTLEFNPPVAYPGEAIMVRITAVAASNAIKGDGVFVDIRGMEEVRIKKGEVQNLQEDIEMSRATLEQSFQISGPFEVAAGGTQVWEGVFQLPYSAQPTFDGSICDHGWGLRGRLAMFGNDPDSGFMPIKVGLKG